MFRIDPVLHKLMTVASGTEEALTGCQGGRGPHRMGTGWTAPQLCLEMGATAVKPLVQILTGYLALNHHGQGGGFLPSLSVYLPPPPTPLPLSQGLSLFDTSLPTCMFTSLESMTTIEITAPFTQYPQG